MHNKSPLTVLTALALTCFASGRVVAGAPLRSERNEAGSAFARDAEAAGAVTCRFNVEDLFIHALNGRPAAGLAIYPEGEAARRPFTGLYVIKREDGPDSHLQVMAGPDKSGNCSLSWTETRLVNESCSAYQQTLKPAEPDNAQTFFSSSYVALANSLKTLLTPVGESQCLVTESDVAWRVNPDSDARGWIKQDHGYDPGAPFQSQQSGLPGNG